MFKIGHTELLACTEQAKGKYGYTRRLPFDPAKAKHTLKRGRHTPWHGKQAKLRENHLQTNNKLYYFY